ncbi:alpha/beta hydrolase family protein [Aestuariimicrobium soli]|uniref:alpha/beta hydrolase family protein n=1 Tax=Aestuariimicrobium soli TaxID=2035834 RepID=UPI003EBCB58E
MNTPDPVARQVTTEEALAGSPAWSELKAAPLTRGGQAELLWLESRPTENRRTTIVGLHGELTPAPFTVRSRVMEYGGGAWDARDGVIVAVDDARGQLVRVATPGEPERALAPASSEVRFGGLQVHPERGIVLAVREDHRGVAEGSASEPVTTVVVLALDEPNDDFGQVVVAGADFVAGPRLSADGRLAWFEWNHPNMPWDRSAVRYAPLTVAQGRWGLGEITTVMDEPEVSAQHPQWGQSTASESPAGEVLWFMSDETGWWNLHCHTVDEGSRVAWPVDDDCDHPVWTLAPPRWSATGRPVVHRLSRGWPVLTEVDPDNGDEYRAELSGLAEVDSVVRLGGVAHALVSQIDAGDAIVRLEVDRDHLRVTPVAGGERPGWLPSEPHSISVPGPHGDVQAWLYLPVGAQSSSHPLIVKSHGGPTSYASIAHSPLTDFWTSRGFAVVDVNYSGSTGFGRDYRNRLRGQWGVLDVGDCVAVVDHLVDAGIVDERRVSITGGSAGGYTTLQSLVTTDRYTAGVSRYGIGDLVMLATDTHKFESRYLDSLVGPWPADEQTYLDRSPIHHLDSLATPMLILQGLDDKVVPPNQARAMAEAVEAKGLQVELKLYEGEGHGFRGGEARRDALERELAFYRRLFG